MFHAHGSFTGVVEAGCELVARIVDVGAGHSSGQRRGGRRRKRVSVGIWRFFGFRGGLLRDWWGCGPLRADPAHTGKQDKSGHRCTKSKAGKSIHCFSSGDFFSSMDRMILISALCVLSASVAKLKMSASWPAPAVLNKSFTMISAPLWC